MQTGGTELPPGVSETVTPLLAGMRRVLGAGLVGVYLRGSLALGDFIPATSDVDLLAVTERALDEAQFAALAELHAAVDASTLPYAGRVEIAYIDGDALRRFEPGMRHATLGQGERLAWSEHHTNWILERWTVAEHGIVLLGPDPRSLIDPVDTGELRAAVRERLRDWADWAAQTDDPDWQLPRSHKAYVVETMCRALYTLARGELPGKPRAVVWALTALPEPWHDLIARSQTWRTDRTLDPALAPEVQRFVRWAAGYPDLPSA